MVAACFLDATNAQPISFAVIPAGLGGQNVPESTRESKNFS